MTDPVHPFGFATRVVHAGQSPDPATGAVVTPIYATSTYVQSSPGVHQGFEYSRSQNPTRFAYERCVADLEGGDAGFAFASGLAATSTVLELLNSGDHVVALDDIYGGTRRLFEQVRRRSAGLTFSYSDLVDSAALERVLTPKTRMIWVETPSNPLLKLVDLEMVATAARLRGILTVADNTFATPWAQRPLEYDFDIIIHSATKYLNGHSDMIGGVAVCRGRELAERLGYLQNAIGGVASPFDSFLALRGLKTLSLRMERHSTNAFQIATWLEQHPKIERVMYPGLASHPQYALARRQMDGRFGGMIGAVVRGSLNDVTQFLSRCRLFTLAESLGGVESLIEHPALMTHASVPPEVRRQLGFDDGLVRLSVGIEAVEDLIADLEHALA
ncbi:Cystathionine beta-lyase [Candidatus Competibacter denitrificans Run_A_D11]|uniref:Cystathionine beta-lyase n=1 Tax=Candidatus Competibacter denitrificans Run_A_D11 TaxID=1400863 RepID=W6M8W3_9GAMM|nr:PLP-dependent aspartate aminotransferase family protein [Candidatus Competibacter denitrificans]CDI04022.1 Cystathionine beta-lyase [Candidatus Competibacter denitrificans Run_A_D11]HAS85567.1 PLP-dependent transferase [Candidatus Competibacteraceae bacterium]HRC70080.1 PLP-dependent aspartate aminotransferase family protein [Candidatus Competibacter denitrificans]